MDVITVQKDELGHKRQVVISPVCLKEENRGLRRKLILFWARVRYFLRRA